MLPLHKSFAVVTSYSRAGPHVKQYSVGNPKANQRTRCPTISQRPRSPTGYNGASIVGDYPFYFFNHTGVVLNGIAGRVESVVERICFQ